MNINGLELLDIEVKRMRESGCFRRTDNEWVVYDDALAREKFPLEN